VFGWIKQYEVLLPLLFFLLLQCFLLLVLGFGRQGGRLNKMTSF
jgi:hypothetical protein